MNLLLLGRGKTGALVAEVARERRHAVTVLGQQENERGQGIAAQIGQFDCAVDFTTPEAVLDNIAACARIKLNLVVGATGWYAKLDDVRRLVSEHNIGLLYAANFSVGIHLMAQIARSVADAPRHGYSITIVERHHVHKKDAPSGTAIMLQQAVEQASGYEPEIQSIREGETVGTHVLLLDGPNDTMMLVHDAKSRLGFAEGAVKAAEWLAGKQGFFTMEDMLRDGGSQ